MTQSAHTAHQSLSRLEQLEHYLLADPANLKLRRETFDAALRERHWERAAHHLGVAQDQIQSQEQAQARLEWALKESDFWLAQKEWLQARAVLQPLSERAELPLAFKDAVLHNLAYIDFSQNDAAACAGRLAPRMETSAESAVGELPSAGGKLQQLWLRALHRDGQIARALQWARAMDQSQRLDPLAAAIASTMALDEEELGEALRWSSAALVHWEAASRSGLPLGGGEHPPLEALVTQAWLALIQKNGALASELAQRALQVQPNEARAWSAWGYADLLLGRSAAEAEAHFQQAAVLQPSVLDHWSGLAWSQLAQQHTAAAIDSLHRALALDETFAETHGALALAHALQGERERAAQYLQSAQQLDPQCHSAQHAKHVLDHPEFTLSLQDAMGAMPPFSSNPSTRH
jgi:tetratricopeptide (TPR) repeat protein